MGFKVVYVYLDIAVWNENIYTELQRYKYPNFAAAKRFVKNNLSELIPRAFITDEDGVILTVHNWRE